MTQDWGRGWGRKLQGLRSSLSFSLSSSFLPLSLCLSFSSFWNPHPLFRPSSSPWHHQQGGWIVGTQERFARFKRMSVIQCLLWLHSSIENQTMMESRRERDHKIFPFDLLFFSFFILKGYDRKRKKKEKEERREKKEREERERRKRTTRNKWTNPSPSSDPLSPSLSPIILVLLFCLSFSFYPSWFFFLPLHPQIRSECWRFLINFFPLPHPSDTTMPGFTQDDDDDDGGGVLEMTCQCKRERERRQSERKSQGIEGGRRVESKSWVGWGGRKWNEESINGRESFYFNEKTSSSSLFSHLSSLSSWF